MALDSFVSMPMSPPLMPISPVDYGAMAMSSDEMSIFNATDSMEGILQDDHSASPFAGLCHGNSNGHGGFSGAFNAPTMHPNLVSTLKNVISQQSMEDGLHFLNAPHHGFESGGIEDTGLASEDGFLNYQTEAGFQPPPPQQQQNDNDNSKKKQPQQKTRRSPKIGREEDDREDRQIATVPVDLIQNRRPFKCAYGGCDKTFKNPQTLKMHHKTHYSDDAAEKRLGEQLLNNNTAGNCRAGHNKKIPCRCPVCKRTFVGLYELRRHFGRKHSEGEKMYGCRKCGSVGSRLASYGPNRYTRALGYASTAGSRFVTRPSYLMDLSQWSSCCRGFSPGKIRLVLKLHTMIFVLVESYSNLLLFHA